VSGGHPNPSKTAKKVTDAATADLLSGDHLAVVVDSPPGAGKSTFVVGTAVRLADDQDQVPIVAQTNAQADDLVRSLLRHPGRLPIGRLTGSSGGSGLDKAPKLTISSDINALDDCSVIVGTAAKWAYVASKIWPYEAGIIDEAYQMRSDQLLYVGQVFNRALMVGDPGQLDPFSPIDDERWRGYADGPINPAVATVLHNHPTSPVHRLPVSWRLPALCAPLVSEAFYPTIPFEAGTTVTDRRLVVEGTGSTRVDRAIELAADAGWSYLELDERIVPPTDREAVAVVVEVVLRLLTLGVSVVDASRDPVEAPLSADGVAIGVVHRNQRAAVLRELERQAQVLGLDASGVVVDTANRLQGREFDVVVVLHPLSGRASASEFHLETGRLCVLLSRHRQACVVVGRAGIADVLDAHPGDTPIWIGAPIPVPDGWEANQIVLERLLALRV
jgi:hypothetical protein